MAVCATTLILCSSAIFRLLPSRPKGPGMCKGQQLPTTDAPSVPGPSSAAPTTVFGAIYKRCRLSASVFDELRGLNETSRLYGLRRAEMSRKRDVADGRLESTSTLLTLSKFIATCILSWFRWYPFTSLLRTLAVQKSTIRAIAATMRDGTCACLRAQRDYARRPRHVKYCGDNASRAGPGLGQGGERN